jgi:hypothetical protein
MHECRICGISLPLTQMQAHLGKCVERNADVVDAFRPKRAFEGDPELARFARAEGSVWNRRPGTRRQPR